MVSLRTVGDRFENQAINIDQTSDDKSSSWSILLVTSDLTQDLLDQSDSLQANIQIVDGDDLNGSMDPNSFLLPVELSALVSTKDGKRKSYYRQRFSAKGSQQAPALTLEGYVITDQSDTQNFDNPFILIAFSPQDTGGQNQQRSNDQQMERQQFQGSQSNDTTGDMSRRGPHTYDDEIANGGLDLATTGDNRNQTERQSADDLNRQTQDA